MSSASLKPFLKWAGGKRWLFESGQFSLPDFKGKYFEPFLGGGAVFFEAQPDSPILSDSNNKLIELYIVIRDDLDEFYRHFRGHAECHCKDYYYETRSKEFSDITARAAQFLYLNRTCWNGLYRENLKGKFNVPIGTKNSVISASDNFPEWSKALQKSRLECRDFEAAIDEAEKDDFVFVDPPYTVLHNANGFIKYNQNIFAWDDQKRLCEALKRAVERGASFAMTNANHESIKELYNDFGLHKYLSRHSVIAGASAHRSLTTELLVHI